MIHNNMISKLRYAASSFALAVLLAWTGSPETAAQSGAREKSVGVSVTIIDGNGNPIPSAELSVGEGQYHHTADKDGAVSFSASPRDLVTISKDGYSSVTVLVEALADSETVTLNEDLLYASEKDIVPLPYMEMLQRYSVGSTIVIQGEELEKYSSTDIRNALTAIAPGVEVTENFGDPGVTPLENANRYGSAWAVTPTARGRRMVYMVDDIPVHINETPLDPQQIESITIVRDVLEKTLYGPSGAEGIVYIKTKRGRSNDRYLNVFVEGGVNMPDKMPEYVGGADYARLNNVARSNSGMTPLYTADDVAAYSKKDPYDLFHPNVDFRDMMLKDAMWYTRAGVQSGGGNDVVKYYAYLGYSGEDDIYKIGPAADYNRININANLDIKLHKYITAKFGLISSMGIRRSSNYGYDSNYSSDDESSNSTLGVTEFPDIISDINTIPAISFPIYASNDPSLESPWYAVTSQYTQNPIANITENGSYTETIRKGLINVGIDLDLSFLTKGLKSYTYGAFDATNLVRLGTAEDYAAYILTPQLQDGEMVMVPQMSGSHSVKTMSNKAKLLDYFSNRLYFVEKISYDRTFGKHRVNAGADYMITKRSQKWITEHRREMNFGFNAGYVYDDRYIVQTAMNWHGTYSLLNNTWAYSPSVGLGWIMSEESWLKDVDNLDFLKIRAQGGILHYDSATSANRDRDNYSWNNSGSKFGPYQQNQWFGSTQSENINRTYISMLGNPNLRMEQRKEFIAGIDGLAFDRRFSFSANYYNILSDGPITELANVIPLVAGISSGALWMNYNKTRYQGYEVSLGWSDKAGDFSYAVNGWAAGQFSKVLRVDEMNYKQAYRSKVGYSSSAIWGLRYIGQFQSDAETLEVPQLFDESLVAGDLKYEDMNGDGFVDDNDVCVIGDSSPKLIYGITVNLKYRDFDLFLAGTGRAFYDIALTNGYFWNGWSDGNYSRYTLDNVNNPSHPRLTYNKVENNYKTSSYWLTDGGFFKLQTVELGYELPVHRLNIARGIRGLRVYLRGNNLLTLTDVKYVDPEATNSGISNYPLMRTFVAGIKVTF
mgnify:CR=1 FL=1